MSPLGHSSDVVSASLPRMLLAWWYSPLSLAPHRFSTSSCLYVMAFLSPILLRRLNPVTSRQKRTFPLVPQLGLWWGRRGRGSLELTASKGHLQAGGTGVGRGRVGGWRDNNRFAGFGPAQEGLSSWSSAGSRCRIQVVIEDALGTWCLFSGEEGLGACCYRRWGLGVGERRVVRGRCIQAWRRKGRA